MSDLKARLLEILKEFPEEDAAKFVLTVMYFLHVKATFRPEMTTVPMRRHQLRKISDAAVALLDAISSLQTLDLRPPAERAMRLARVATELGGFDELMVARQSGELDAVHRELDLQDGVTHEEVEFKIPGDKLRGASTNTDSDPDEFPGVDECAIDTIRAAHGLMTAANSELKSLPRVRSGRPGADACGDLTQIARQYLRILGSPPTQSKSGPFYRLAVEITGQREPERAVKKAVLALKQRRNTPKK